MADIIGTNTDDYISTTNDNDRVDGLSGNDVINGSAGNDVIDGGQDGTNQVDYDGWLADYSFSLGDNGSVLVTKPNGGVDTLSNIGGLWFCQEDRWVAIKDLPYDDGKDENDAPTGRDDWADVVAGEPSVIDVLANDCDPDGDALQITAINGVAMQTGWNTWVENVGLITVNGDGTLTIESPYPGNFCFDYTVTDGNGGTSTATVEGKSNYPATANAEPDAQNDQVTGTVGTISTFSPLENDTDADGDTLTITAINGTQMQPGWSTWVDNVGTVTVNADGTLSLDSQYVGSFCFEYTITDGNGETSTATVEGTNTPPASQSPESVDDSVSGEAGETLVVSPLSNDSDADGDTLTITEIHGTPMQAGWVTWVEGVGLVTLNADNTLTIEPAAGVESFDFEYTISDGNGQQSTANISGTIDVPNTTDAVDDAASTEHNTPITIDVLGNDVDAEADAFSVTGFGNGANGTVSQGQNGELIYTPNAGFCGTDTFTYTITDANGATDTATVSVDVQEPVIPNTTDAVDDAASTEHNTPITIDVLGNDVDAEADTFSVTGFGNGANGTVSQGQNGELIYTPNAGFCGTDTFTYTITDANGATDTATVSVDVQEPVIPNTTDAVDDAATAEFNTPISIDVLGNDVDAEADAFSVTGFGNGANGTVSQGQNGELIYTPNAGFCGTDTFTYTITDANGATDTATVSVDVQEPVIPNTTDAVDDAASTEHNTPITIDVLGNDVDAEADTFSVTGFGNGANGTVSQGQNGELIYTPNAGFCGTDTFTYTITDANGATDTATVSVDVQEPVIPNTTDAVDDAATAEFNTPISIDVLGNDVDAEADAFSVTGFGNGANGTVSQGQNGELIYTPNAGFCGTDTFTYTISDANGATDTAAVSVDVQEPVIPNTTDAVDDAATAEFNTPISIDVLGNDTDAENHTFSVTGFGNGANGTVSQGQNGELVYSPNAGFSGTDTFTYTITDANGAVDTATVSVDVQPPIANSSIGNQVFLDSNGNGVQDAGEAGVADVTVNLKDASGAVIDTQQTDANGNYLFDDLVAGDYSVGVVAPDDFALTAQDAGTDDAADSDINVTTGMSDTVTLGENEQNLTVDAGLVDISTDLEADSVKVCEDDAGTFNVLTNDTGEGLRLVGVTHETPELQAEFEARGGELSFDADGNVTYTGMTDYYGNDVLIYTVEDASGEQFTQMVDVDVEATSDAGQVDVTEDYQRGISGYREDTNYQYHFTHRITAERVVLTQYFEPFFNDEKDALQQFGDYNTGVADDSDTIAFIELFDAEDNGSTWRLNGVEIDPVNETVRVPWSEIAGGNLTLQLPKPWTEQTFNFQVVDTGGSVSGQKGANVSSSDFLTTWTPVALDLNGDGKIGVTGETSSHQKDPDAEIGDTVQFDIDADGDLDAIEWYDGSGDGILVDTSKIGEDGSIDGSALFGDEGGQYANGYEKLAAFDTDGDGQVSGDELNTIGVWIDDGDAVLEEGELKTVDEAGIESVSTQMEIILDGDGNELMQSTATTLDGEVILTEDVWFAEDPLSAMEEVGLPDVEEFEDCFG